VGRNNGAPEVRYIIKENYSLKKTGAQDENWLFGGRKKEKLEKREMVKVPPPQKRSSGQRRRVKVFTLAPGGALLAGRAWDEKKNTMDRRGGMGRQKGISRSARFQGCLTTGERRATARTKKW